MMEIMDIFPLHQSTLCVITAILLLIAVGRCALLLPVLILLPLLRGMAASHFSS